MFSCEAIEPMFFPLVLWLNEAKPVKVVRFPLSSKGELEISPNGWRVSEVFAEGKNLGGASEGCEARYPPVIRRNCLSYEPLH